MKYCSLHKTFETLNHHQKISTLQCRKFGLQMLHVLVLAAALELGDRLQQDGSVLLQLRRGFLERRAVVANGCKNDVLQQKHGCG